MKELNYSIDITELTFSQQAWLQTAIEYTKEISPNGDKGNKNKARKLRRR
jgi:hypothetical protein